MLKALLQGLPSGHRAQPPQGHDPRSGCGPNSQSSALVRSLSARGPGCSLTTGPDAAEQAASRKIASLVGLGFSCRPAPLPRPLPLVFFGSGRNKVSSLWFIAPSAAFFNLSRSSGHFSCDSTTICKSCPSLPSYSISPTWCGHEIEGQHSCCKKPCLSSSSLKVLLSDFAQVLVQEAKQVLW